MGTPTIEIVPTSRDSKLNMDYGTMNDPAMVRNAESFNQKLSYPKAVIFVLLSKFFEAFAANGVRTILALYLRDSLSFKEESSMTFYHVFNFFSQFCPIFGAILADSYFGNVKTIFYLFLIYACGWIGIVVLTLPFTTATTTPLIIASLIIISIGNGGVRACVTSLGGSQFILPTQSAKLEQYFSHYYFIYTLGILLSKVIPPEIRAHTQCFGRAECYSAVYGSLASMFLVAWIIFLVGMFFYRKEEAPDADNLVFQVISCVYFGIKDMLRRLLRISSMGYTWIDEATEIYSESFVLDVRAIFKVLKLFIQLPMYWALFTQIDSSWTFQSTELDMTVLGHKFEADQAKAVGAILLLILIPLWQSVFAPILLRYNIQISPIASIIMGGMSAALSFMCAAILQLNIESRPDRLSVLWQFPQFTLIMFGEVWLSIPGLSFSFTQSPPSMRSVMMAAWFCNNAFGNLIIIGITEIHPFKLTSSLYFFYAFLMLLAMILFAWIAKNYRYSNYDNTDHREHTNLTLTPVNYQRQCLQSSQDELNYLI